MANDLRQSNPTINREQVGNYEVVRKIATGGMGEVFLARQKGPVDFSRYVVLKKLHPRLTADPHFVTMFLNEARIAANLTHPNIIHIYELFQDGPGYVIAMEYVRGGTVLALLRERQRRGTKGLPWGPMVRIASSVCEALHYAYNEEDDNGMPRKVIHRDVSPSNVLVGYDGQVKLVDFGIAKALEAEALTQAATIKGKYGYMSPEQIKCQQLDQRTDIFSLGTMLWEMSVGNRLFRRDNDLQMLYAILEERIPLPSERMPDYPKGLEYIVMKALARDRDQRYPDANSLAQDLRAIARDNEWDSEASTLSRLVKDVLPEDMIAFGRTGEPDSRPSAERPGHRAPTAVTRSEGSEGTGSWVEVEPTNDDEFAPRIVVIDPNTTNPPERPVASAEASAQVEEDTGGGMTAGTWLAIAVLLVASAVFWVVIAPSI
jgi:eukaryotic-like serine/threonine-protein kinase